MVSTGKKHFKRTTLAPVLEQTLGRQRWETH